jgi:polyhydroxybutyrate depolymerase
MKTYRRAGIYFIFLVALACRLTPGGEATAVSDVAVPEPNETSDAGPNAEPTSDLVSSGEIEPLDYATGQNSYLIPLEGVERNFIVYVPASYDPTQAAPMVFMYHGSNQAARVMYTNTSWNAHAETHGIIVVYPDSWEYRLLEDNRVHDKWNTSGMAEQLVDPTELKDDVAFTRSVLDLMQASFNIDPARIFASGFSNGGGFVMTRLMFELDDVFAAFSVSGTALWRGVDPANMPRDFPLNLYIVMGTQDDKISEGLGHPTPFPIAPDGILADSLFGPMLSNTAAMLSLNNDPVVNRDPPYTTFIYSDSLIGADNEFRFRMVKGMFHVYNNGEKIPEGFDAAELFWEFFNDHPLE